MNHFLADSAGPSRFLVWCVISEREQVWRGRIESQQWSGLTVAECCEEAGVSVASFYLWKKLLTEPQGSRRLRSTQRTEVQASRPEKRAE